MKEYVSWALKNILIVILLTVYIDYVANGNLPFEENTVRGVVGSGSMIPLINKNIYPNIKTENYILDMDDDVKVGRVYIYTREEDDGNTTYIVHRLIGIYNISDEIVYVFRGDNNLYADKPVYRWQIVEEVRGVLFE